MSLETGSITHWMEHRQAGLGRKTLIAINTCIKEDGRPLNTTQQGTDKEQTEPRVKRSEVRNQVGKL